MADYSQAKWEYDRMDEGRYSTGGLLWSGPSKMEWDLLISQHNRLAERLCDLEDAQRPSTESENTDVQSHPTLNSQPVTGPHVPLKWVVETTGTTSRGRWVSEWLSIPTLGD